MSYIDALYKKDEDKIYVVERDPKKGRIFTEYDARYVVGATTQCYASYRRGAAWVMILTFYFSCVNIFGYGVAAGWWQ